jgi:outer membrane protein assembly factor BamB/tetratricopeptide (TPR) repeat protein
VGRDWLLFRGDAARAGSAAADVPLLEPRWSVPTTDEETSREMLKSALAARFDPNAPPSPIPGGVPIAVAGKVIYRDFGGVRALDADTGRSLWHAASPLSLDALLGDSNRRQQVLRWFSLYGNVRSVLYQNYTLGALSSDGSRVFAVEDLALPPHPQQMFEYVSQLRKHFFSTLKDALLYNTLRALDVHTGTVLWEVGGRGRSVPSELRDAYFLGPPLPLGACLYALVEKQEDVNLVCLTPEKGELLWAQNLATARDKILVDVNRRIQAAHLAYADGVLVCPTNTGAVLGFDPLSRRLLWAHTYRDKSLVPGEGQPFLAPEMFRASWKACAPILRDGKVVFTAPDCDSVRCLNLQDGSLLWKATQTEDDLHVGGVVGGKVLVVGRTACRALSLASGEQLWKHPTGQPSGLGVAGGKVFYLPMKQRALLALDVDDPKQSSRIDCRSGDAPGNLLFHQGFLWSQGVLTVAAYPQLAVRLVQVEQRLKDEPGDVEALSERGKLRLSKGDLAGAVADLRQARQLLPKEFHDPDVLYETFTQLLQRDFTAGEHYLDEYRELCRVEVPAGASAAKVKALQAEGRRRQDRYLALLAAGREGQGRVADALRAYRELLDSARPGELLAAPEDPAVQVRPDLWVQARVAALASRLRPEQRQMLQAQIDREWLTARSGDSAALARFVALYGGIEGPAGAPGREARFLLAEKRLEDPDRRQALQAELDLLALQRSADPAGAARALEARARLYVRLELLEDALECYRTLARDYPHVEVQPGKTGAACLADLTTDKRFLALFDVPRPTWTPGKIKAVETRGNFPFSPFNFFQPYGEAPPSWGELRFGLDWQASRFVVANRDSGAERWSTALPVNPQFRGFVGMSWRSDLRGEVLTPDDGNVFPSVGHLAVLNLGYTVAGIDLLHLRLRWSRPLLPEASPAVPFNPFLSPTILVGPLTQSGFCLHSRNTLSCIDPAGGEVRWTRSDVPANLEVFGDEDHLYLVEQHADGGVRAVRAVRTSDGTAVPIPDGVAACTHKIRSLGRTLLVSEKGSAEEVRLRLYDTHTGKDLWEQTFPARSLVLDSPAPELLAVVAPDGAVTVVDLKERREVLKLNVEPKHLEKVQKGTLLRDRTQIYLAFQGPNDGAANTVGDFNPNVVNLPVVPVNGMLYAFDRATGELRWHSRVAAQMIVLERFEDLPVLLFTAQVMRTLPPGLNLPVMTLRSIDKHTGKVRFNREYTNVMDGFHTLRVDARTGAIDLIGSSIRLRHVDEK